MARTFASRMIAEMRPMIRATAESIVDQHHQNGKMDVLADYASTIPARTIAQILGLDPQDIPHFTSLVYTCSGFLGSWGDEDLPVIEAAARDLVAYVAQTIERSRLDSGPKFIRDYLASVDSDGGLSPIEALMQIVTLIVAGSDTTRAAIVVQTSLLLQNHGQWQMLLNRPDLVASAVLECLRYEPAVGSVMMVAADDITIDGYTVPNGSVLGLMTMSTMRDEAQYAEPDRFDIGRPSEKWHPMFGGGAHRCLGEGLAKAELEESLIAL